PGDESVRREHEEDVPRERQRQRDDEPGAHVAVGGIERQRHADESDQGSRFAHVLQALVLAGDGQPVAGCQHRRHHEHRPRPPPRARGRRTTPNGGAPPPMGRSRRPWTPLYAGDPMLTDAELVASARSGDRGALSEMYDGYADRLYDLCTSVLRDADAAFDA